MTQRRRFTVDFKARLTDAILDRLVHNAYRLELDGETMRKRLAQKQGAET